MYGVKFVFLVTHESSNAIEFSGDETTAGAVHMIFSPDEEPRRFGASRKFVHAAQLSNDIESRTTIEREWRQNVALGTQNVYPPKFASINATSATDWQSRPYCDVSHNGTSLSVCRHQRPYQLHLQSIDWTIDCCWGVNSFYVPSAKLSDDGNRCNIIPKNHVFVASFTFTTTTKTVERYSHIWIIFCGNDKGQKRNSQENWLVVSHLWIFL